MTREVRAMVLAGNGINCERETAHACRKAGVDEVDITYIWDLASGKASLAGYRLLCLPGGFLDGDDLGSARASAIRLRNTSVDGSPLVDQIKGFVGDGGLMIGICNGFQLMIKLGLLPASRGNLFEQQATLTWNKSGRFEDRWVHLKADPESPCVFTRGLSTLELPVRHGEGQIIAPDETVDEIMKAHLAPLAYIDPATGKETTDYPLNPNGTVNGMAALTDPTGRLFGLMPHPEAFLHRTNHPRWTREDLPEDGAGLALFANAVNFIREE